MSTQPPVNATPSTPANPPGSGTIDITNLVETVKTTFINWASKLIVTTASGYFPPLAWPVISTLFNYFVTKIVTVIANAAEMQAFFMNTAIRKASQAQDYINAVNAKASLPPTASDEEYEKAEQAEMAAFRNFVMVTN
jgi:hypothetical protein